MHLNFSACYAKLQIVLHKTTDLNTQQYITLTGLAFSVGLSNVHHEGISTTDKIRLLFADELVTYATERSPFALFLIL